MIYPHRRRSRALSKANIKHDLRRGSRSASRGDIFLNVNDKHADHRHGSRSPKPPRKRNENGASDQRHPPKSPREPRHASRSPKSTRERPELREDNSKV